MKEKTHWAKSSNGPDVLDCEGMMRALGALHSGHVAVTFSPSGTGFNTGVVITAGIAFETLPGSALPSMVTTDCHWPTPMHADFWGAVYNLLYQLDQAIGATYKNEALWE